MRLAILSDIHGNIVAFDSVLADLKDAGQLDAIWVLGDLVAFGSSPLECAQKVQALPNVRVIQGNTDRYLVSGVRPALPPLDSPEDWPRVSDQLAKRDSIFQWIVERLDHVVYAYLRDLPTELVMEVAGYGQLHAFHAAPGDDEFGFAPETGDDIISEKLAGIPAGLVMMGHTHRPMDRQIGSWRVLNVGSVGLPFDGDPRAAYVLLEFDDGGSLTVHLRRVAYDIDQEILLLEKHKNPAADFQAARMRSGLMSMPKVAGG